MPDSPLTPLSPLTMAILLALAEGDRHGYALMQSIEAQSEGRLAPGTGSLYAALDRLLEQGLIAEAGEEVVDGRNRRAWRLTEEGRRTAGAEARRMIRIVEAARRHDLVDGGGDALPAPAAGS